MSLEEMQELTGVDWLKIHVVGDDVIRIVVLCHFVRIHICDFVACLQVAELQGLLSSCPCHVVL